MTPKLESGSVPAADPEASAPPGRAPTETPRLLIELLGAAAGIIAFLYLVGGIVYRARLDALELPDDSTVALLSRETILIAGVRALAVPLGAALVALFVLWLLDLRESPDEAAGADKVQLARSPKAAVVLALIAALEIYALTQPFAWGAKLAVVAAGLVAFALSLLVLRETRDLKRANAGILILVALFGAVLAYERAGDPPVKLDWAVLHIKDGARTSGFLLGTSSEDVLIAPDVNGHTIDRVVAVPRDEVVDLRVHSASEVSPLHSHGDTIDNRLSGIRGSTLWKYPPIMFADSIRTWRKRSTEFPPSGRQEWKNNDGVPASLSELNEEPLSFAGQIVITQGRLVAAATELYSQPPKGYVVQDIVLEDPSDKRFRGVCSVVIARDRRLERALPTSEGHRDDVVQVRAIVLAAGLTVAGSGTELRRVAMMCSAAQPATDL
jgi:hypothetical protein